MTLDFRACAVTLFLACFPNPADATCADLSLVLAIDSSGSIDDNEFGIQTVGYAAAFQNLGVKRALAAAGVVDGTNTKTRQYRNFGMANPEGYRKALQLMKLAEKFNKPVITLIDTPGAYPGL